MKHLTYPAIKWGARLSLAGALLLVTCVAGVIIHCRITGTLPGPCDPGSGLCLFPTADGDGGSWISYHVPGGPSISTYLTPDQLHLLFNKQ